MASVRKPWFTTTTENLYTLSLGVSVCPATAEIRQDPLSVTQWWRLRQDTTEISAHVCLVGQDSQLPGCRGGLEIHQQNASEENVIYINNGVLVDHKGE